MKQTLIAIATILASFAQAYFIGLNGLTTLTILLTIYLGLHVIEKITEEETI